MCSQFLNVAEDESLSTHLRNLTAKYPLSTFEREMVDFLECASKQLGKPSLARVSPSTICLELCTDSRTQYEAAATPAGQVPSPDPDPYALTRYFARTEFVDEPIPSAPHRASEDGNATKRRKLE